MEKRIKYICLFLWVISFLGIFHVNYIKDKEKKQLEYDKCNEISEETYYQRADFDKKNALSIVIFIINKTIDTYERSRDTTQ